MQRPRSFCTCWRMLVLWILRWHCFCFVSASVSVHLAHSTPFSLMANAICLIMTFMMLFLNALQWMPLATPGNRPNSLLAEVGWVYIAFHTIHHAAAYISPASASEHSVQCPYHTCLYLFNALIPSAGAITLDDIVSSPCRQHALSSKFENHQFKLLFDHSSLPDRAHLLSVSPPNAAARLSVLPSQGLNLHMDSPEFQVALKWWLGMDLD